MFRAFQICGAAALVLGLGTGIFLTRTWWVPRLAGPRVTDAPSLANAGLEPVAAPIEQVKLSPQARNNLRLTSGPLRATTYRRSIQIPGTVVDRPGVSDRDVVSPTSAIVTAIHGHVGDVVRPGEPLFSLRLVGEALHTSQTELFKAVKDQEITQEQIDRLEHLAQSGGIPQARLIELRNDLRRAEVIVQAHRQDLRMRGLSPAQIDTVVQGTFVSEAEVVVPSASPLGTASGLDAEPDRELAEQRSDPLAGHASAVFEVQTLAIQLGQQVQAGQRLCTLAHHQSLLIEGRAFPQEVPRLQVAAEQASPIVVELLEQDQQDWPDSMPPVVIEHFSNTLNNDNRTVSFYLPLANQFRTYQRQGRTRLLWRFRPGQRVRLHVQVETLANVFVLPAAAVMKEGPEYYIFRRNGDFFDRRPVHVLHRTHDEIVIANDGSVPAGIHVAQTGAVQLNRVLKSQSGSAPAGVHVHADGSVHANH